MMKTWCAYIFQRTIHLGSSGSRTGSLDWESEFHPGKLLSPLGKGRWSQWRLRSISGLVHSGSLQPYLPVSGDNHYFYLGVEGTPLSPFYRIYDLLHAGKTGKMIPSGVTVSQGISSWNKQYANLAYFETACAMCLVQGLGCCPPQYGMVSMNFSSG